MTNQQQPTLPGIEGRERTKKRIHRYLLVNVISSGLLDHELEAILNICQDGSDAGRASSELQGEFATLLEIVQNMRTQQRKFYAAKLGTLECTHAFRESKRYESEADQFLKGQDDIANAKPETPTLF